MSSMNYPYQQLSLDFGEPELSVEYCDPVVRVEDWEPKVLGWANPRPTDAAITEYLLTTRLIFAADDSDDLAPFDTWPPDQLDDDFLSDEELIAKINAQAEQTAKDIVKGAIKGYDITYKFVAPTEEPAKCVKCGLTNEYATPSAEYVCFECRV